MSNGAFSIPRPVNEPVLSYAPGTPARRALQSAYETLYQAHTAIPQFINGVEIFNGKKIPIRPPHDHQHTVGYWCEGDQSDVRAAIEGALEARSRWAAASWEQRAAIFLKAADLIAGPYRAQINAATMIGQSKNAIQAELDAACELVDFLRFNAYYMEQIYKEQPESTASIWNRMEYRPLEGFTFAITPFNFTAIAGNLPSCMALMGNVVVWKPSDKQALSAHYLMKVFRESGLPAGVINMVMGDPAETAKTVFGHPDFAGVHFTGSTQVFKDIWEAVGKHIHTYKTYPRIVGETGGKDFVIAHPTAQLKPLATALSRGAFEYQGQKCSAASRAYLPKSLWEEVKETLNRQIERMKMGSPADFGNFINAVIDRKAYNRITAYIERAKESTEAEIISGGAFGDAEGYFISPTVIQTTNPKYETLVKEIFGPVLTVYVYEDEKWDETLDLIDETSPYALTGAVFSQDRYAIEAATERLADAAGNLYINDKPSGAVVGQQPFGGGRASGTNDKAGSKLNLLRWTSPRTIKENFIPPTDFPYPFMEKGGREQVEEQVREAVHKLKDLGSDIVSRLSEKK